MFQQRDINKLGPIENGRYDATITAFEVTDNRFKREVLKAEYVIDNGEHQGKRVVAEFDLNSDYPDRDWDAIASLCKVLDYDPGDNGEATNLRQYGEWYAKDLIEPAKDDPKKARRVNLEIVHQYDIKDPEHPKAKEKGKEYASWVSREDYDNFEGTKFDTTVVRDTYDVPQGEPKIRPQVKVLAQEEFAGGDGFGGDDFTGTDGKPLF